MNLLDLMRPARKPIWRDGTPISTWQEAAPLQEGDLQWLANDWQDHRKEADGFAITRKTEFPFA
jgi:hypothetical protein